MSLESWPRLHWINRWLWVVGHFVNIIFFNSWIWDSFPFICIFLHFTNVIVLVYKSFTSLDKCISKYFIGFEVIVNEITHFSDNLFSVNRNTTDTCTLILYPETLLNLLIRPNRFSVIQIAVKWREAKSKGEKERYSHLNTEFQRIARRDKKAFLSNQCKK